MAQSDVYGLRKVVSKQIDLTIPQYDGTAKDGDLIIDMNPGPRQYILYVGKEDGYLTDVIAGNALSANYANYAGNVTIANQPNITTVGTLTNLAVAGNATIGGNTSIGGNTVISGNLNVEGDITYINITDLQIEDPIIVLGGGPNGAPLTANDGKDRGTQLQVFDTGVGAPVPKFMGWKDSASEFVLASNVTNTVDVITINSYGNLHLDTLVGSNVAVTGNIDAFDINASNTLSALVDVTAGNSISATMDITAGGNIGATGNVAAGIDVTAGSNVVAGLDITAGGNIGATGNIISSANVDGVNFNASGNMVATGNITATANVAGGNITTGGQVVATGNVVSSANVDGVNMNASGVIIATGNIDGGNLNTTGQVIATGNVVSSANVDGVNMNASGNMVATGNVSGQNISATANLSSANLTVAVGNVDFTTTANVSLGAVANLHISGGINGQVLRTDGSGALTWVDANTAPGGAGANTQVIFNDAGVMGAVSTFTYDKVTDILAVGNVSLTANLSVGGEVLTSLIPNGNKVYDLGNATNRWNSIFLSNNSLYLGAVHVTSNDVDTINIPNANIANLAATGNIVAANISANADIVATGNINATLDIFSNGSIGTLGNLVAAANVYGVDLIASGEVFATGNVTGGNITTGGEVVSTGNITGGNITTGGEVVSTGNVTGGNLVTSGTVSAFDITVVDASVTANITVTDTLTVSNILTTGSNVDFTSATQFNLGSNIFVLPSETTLQADVFVSRADTAATATLDCGTADYFKYTVVGATTFTATNVPAAGRFCSIIIEIVNGGSASVTYFGGTKWASATAPTLTAAGTDVLGFFTTDGGSSWTGLVLGLNIS